MTANSFLKREKVTKVKNKYLTTFHKVDELERTLGGYLPLTGGTLTGNLNINTTSTANNSLTITDTTDSNIREFKFGDNLIYSYKILSNNAERRFEISTNKFEYFEGNNQLKIIPTDITIKTAANNKFENKLGSSSYMNFYNNDNNCLYMGTAPNTSGNMIDWIVAGFKLQLSASLGSLYKQVNGFNSTLTSTSYSAQFNSAGSNSNSVSIGGTNITWRGAQKASYSNPNYDTVDFSIEQYGFDYTGNWYSTQSATSPVQLRIYSGSNDALLYISHNTPTEGNNYISISKNTYDTTISMGCNNGSNYSNVAIGGDSISLNKGLNNSFTRFSAGNGNLETSKDNTGFRFNLTDTSKTKGLTAFKANGVDADFAIEGFHDIINDKFTLSDTYDTSALAEALTQDEIDWINSNSKDILALIMDIKRSGSGTDVVTRAEYNDLLGKYNDLAERLNQFLLNTGEVLVLSNNQLKTKSLDTIEIKIFQQHENNDYTIDWGDGTTDLSGNKSESGSTLTHNYSETGIYIITVTPNNNSAAGQFAADNYFTEVNIKDFQFNPSYDNCLVKGTFDNQILTAGSGESFISDCILEEVHIKENCVVGYATVFENCLALTKVIIDASIIDLNYNFFENCPNLTEVHLTSTTIPTFISGSGLFDTIPDNLKIYVPNNLVNDYKIALPDYATYIIGE